MSAVSTMSIITSAAVSNITMNTIIITITIKFALALTLASDPNSSSSVVTETTDKFNQTGHELCLWQGLMSIKEVF